MPRQTSTILCLLCLLWPGLAACSKRPSSAPPHTLRLSQRNEPSSLDPALASLPDDFFIIRALSEGLVSPATDSSVVPVSNSDLPAIGHRQSTFPSVRPAAAASWDISSDGLTYTFHLRPSGVWSNGEPITAADFLASYRRLLTPATAAPKASLFFAVKNARAFAAGALTDFSLVGFAAPDPHTLVVTLAHPFPQFLLYAASGPWIPVNPRAVARFGPDWTRPENYVGNGPFTLAAWRPHQRIVVKRNPRYHAAPAVHLDEIDFIAFDDGDTEERAFRAGQIDITMAVPFSKLDVYAREHAAEFHRTPLAETRFLAFNTARPPLDDPRVRRALSLALDREEIVRRVLRGGEQPAAALIPPALAPDPSHPSSLSDSSHSSDLATARALLAAAGYPGGRNFPHLELSAWARSQAPILEAIQSMWHDHLGIEVRLAIREAKVHLAALGNARYDIGFVTIIPDLADPLDVLDGFTTASPENYPHWSDATYDALVAEAARTPDPARQSLLLQEAENRLLADAPLVPLYFNAKHWLMSPRVHGWHEDALWTRDYLGVSVDAP
ncbi:MAG TPA: peptide ABC transporter substrate-binding protein [Opitutus sp.]|nr:peptide ABC transporter substrate-binding protein [Opitutus sp.]